MRLIVGAVQRRAGGGGEGGGGHGLQRAAAVADESVQGV